MKFLDDGWGRRLVELVVVKMWDFGGPLLGRMDGGID